MERRFENQTSQEIKSKSCRFSDSDDQNASMSVEENALVNNTKRPRISQDVNVNGTENKNDDESNDLPTEEGGFDSEAEEDDLGNQEVEDRDIKEVINHSSYDEEGDSEDEGRSEGSTSVTESETEDNDDERLKRPMFQGFAGMNGMRGPLKDNGQLITIDHLLLELTHTVRYNNTYEQLLRRLKILKKRYVNINVPTTKEALWRTIGRDESNLFYRLYCEMCHQIVGNGKKVERDCACGACGPHKEETFVATFIQVSLAPQIKEFLDSPKAGEALRYKQTRVKTNPNAIEDIFDGQEYVRMSEDGFLRNPNNFTLSLWTDGLKIAKSAKFSCYPFLLQLNELSPQARKRNMFLAGLWVGRKEPSMNVIMESIVKDTNELYDIGIRWRPTAGEEIISKFIVAIFTTGPVTRPLVLRMKKYDEEFGCPFCLAKGKDIEGRRIYNTTPADLRTMKTMEEDITAVMTSGEESRGVVGCSRLGSLRKFDLIKGQVVDNVHKDYLGNAKIFNHLYMDNVGKPWYIGKQDKIIEINKILTKIKTPSTISSNPRSIEKSKTWKASEWRNYLLYFMLPCLDGILSEPFFSHQAKYSEAIFILNSSSITNADLIKAKNYLDEFVNETEELYGEVNMRFNVHLNKHSVSSTENWGPAWVFSTLPFQSMSRSIADSVMSPNHRAEQIVTRFFMKKFILRTAEEESISNVTKKEIDDLLDKKTVNQPKEMPETHYFVGEGRPSTRHASSELIRLIIKARGKIEKNTVISFYRKATVHGVSYARKTDELNKYCDHIAYCRDKKFIIIKDIISYQQEEETFAGFIGEEFNDLGGAYNTEYMRFVKTTKNKVFISYHDILAPGILINAKKGTVAVHLCNCWETD